MQPTAEQQREFWEYFSRRGWGEVTGRWIYPPINLNNLFKYAVPKVHREQGNVAIVSHITEEEGWYYSAKISAGRISAEDKDPALALFWAIWAVVTADKTKEE